MTARQIADVLRMNEPPKVGDSEARVQWHSTVRAFERALARSTRGFSYEMFRRACGVEVT